MDLVGYTDSNWRGDKDDRNSAATSFCMEEHQSH
ncbi:hypothetical protein A2U01_0107949, partial [Trifolium medium]|nr:hypothetical protein [Trifolium medium]